MTDLVNHLQRFGWTEVLRVSHLGECWEWNGSRSKYRGGYGQIRIDGRVLRSHRVAYQAWVGDPGDLHVLHRCDNPPCLRPEHLFLGTVADNAADKVAKGRGVNPVFHGEAVPSAKLTWAKVDEIRQLIMDGHQISELGRRFGVTKQAIYKIKKEQTWVIR